MGRLAGGAGLTGLFVVGRDAGPILAGARAAEPYRTGLRRPLRAREQPPRARRPPRPSRRPRRRTARAPS
nr:hypothetical protein GCM10020093_115080 [Planobispora longispora]